MSREYTIVGGGAIGGTIAFHLARAGHSVRVVDTDAAHVAAIRADGLRIRRPDGREERQPLAAHAPDEVAGQLGAVLLAVKAQATGAAVDWIAPRLASELEAGRREMAAANLTELEQAALR
jgi:ketopantoate reductase